MIPEKNIKNLCYDFHCHTTASDGALAPSALLDRAEAQGVEVLAITDHDTVDGYLQVREESRKLTLISGIEFSSQWRNRGVHIVGLGIDVDSPQFQQVVSDQCGLRAQRAEIIAHKLERLGFKGLLNGLEDLPIAQLGRPLFAKIMVENAWVKDEQQAFKKFLGTGKPGDVPVLWPEVSNVVSWIKAAGGVAVLAHPIQYRLTLTKLRELIAGFVDAGGDAIEVSSGNMQAGDVKTLAKLAQQYQLLASAGSDFHDPALPWRELGRFQSLPESCSSVLSQLNG